MKRAINLLSLLSIGILIWTIAIFTATVPQAHSRFAGLPVGTRVPVHFSPGEAATVYGTPLERRNQLRDWLMYTVISDAGLDDESTAQVLFDVPPFRAGYLEPVARFEYSAVRSRTIAAGEVIALVPSAGDQQRITDLASIADQEYKTTGARPNVVHVFEYELSDDSNDAWLTRTSDVSGSDLFSSRYGYVEVPVRTRADLTTFLESANDITSSRFTHNGLVLGGRRIAGNRGLRAEDVAALWQADAGLRKIRAEIDAFDARWTSRRYRYESERQSLERQRAAELAALKARLAERTGGRGVLDASGFSLDPVFDYEALAKLVQLYARGLPIVAARMGKTIDVDAIARAVQSRNAGPLLDFAYQMSQSPDHQTRFLAALMERDIHAAQFQQARYDGALDGTEVGMVLFYTDLLAKLWAMDYEYSAQAAGVEDFLPLLKIPDSPIFMKELGELSNTRLWFGPRDEGFQKTADGILMARTATRVYAASSNGLKPGEEAEPNASSAAFLWWWNNHYDAVAAAEPEYQRLNEIMKWGLVFGRMTNEEFGTLSFLDGVKVAHTNWFPTWAQAQQNLTYTAWNRVAFMPRGYKGTTTEALPRLTSRLENGHQISGGVSLPSRRVLTERPSLSEATDLLVRRSTIKEATTTAEGRILKGFDDVTFEFKPGLAPTERMITVRPRAAARLRGSDLEIRNDAFTYAFERKADRFAVGVKQAKADVGEFSVRRVAGGFEAAFQSHGMERARTVLRVADAARARGADAAVEIARIPGAERVVATGDATFVKLQSSTKWLKISDEGAPSTTLVAGFDVRFAKAGDGGGKRWAAAWVDEPAVRAELDKGPFIRMPADAKPFDGTVVSPTRGPPAGAESIDVIVNGRAVKGWRDGQGWMYVARDRKVDPWSTATVFKSANNKGWAALPDLKRSILAGDNQQIARTLASDPPQAARILSDYKMSSIQKTDALIAAQQPRQAAVELDALHRVFPNDADITMRYAIALLQDGQPQAAKAVVGTGMHGSPTAADRVFASASQRVAATGAKDGRNIATMTRAAELNERLSAGPIRAAVNVLPDPTGTLRMEVRLLDWQAAAARPVAGHPIYFEVGPEFNLATGVKPGVEQAVSDRTIVNRLKSWEVARALPETIVDAKTGVRYARAFNPLQATRLARLGDRPCRDASASGSSPECNDEVYLVRRGAMQH